MSLEIELYFRETEVFYGPLLVGYTVGNWQHPLNQKKGSADYIKKGSVQFLYSAFTNISTWAYFGCGTGWFVTEHRLSCVRKQ